MGRDADELAATPLSASNTVAVAARREYRRRMDDARGKKLAALFEHVTTAPGVLTAAERRAAAEGLSAAPELAAYFDKVRKHAHRIDDAEVAALRAAGHSDDAIYEGSVAAAVAAGDERYQAALRALSGGGK